MKPARRMPSALVMVGLAASALRVMSATQETPAPPQFRVATDLIQLDVSVLDRQRQPVRGLTAADFSVREDGKPQQVVAFSEVHVPGPAAATAPWMAEASFDVQTNQLVDRRLVVLVLDSWAAPLDTWEKRTGKKVAHDIVDRLGPADLAAVVVVSSARYSQDFTADRSLIRAAIEQQKPVHAPVVDAAAPMGSDFLDVLADVSRYLAQVPNRRKAVFYIGTGTNRGGFRDRLNDITIEASRANVNFYCIDLNGLRVAMTDMEIESHRTTRDMMLTISNDTGGRATVNTNRPMDGVPQALVENGSYYLLGYVSTNRNRDGRPRRVDVKVNRSGVTVRARRGYNAPSDGANPTSGSTAARTRSALESVLPVRDLPIVATLAPFAVPGRREASVAVAVGLSAASSTTANTQRTATVDLLIRAFTPIGDPRGTKVQTARVTTGPGDAAIAFDALTEMPLLPGRYDLRIAAHDPTADRDGSVYAFVEIPDFAREPLSMSGVVVSTEPAQLAGPRDALAAILATVPTTQREFGRTDRVTTFLRVYQGGQTPLGSATLAIAIRDAQDRVVFNGTQALDPARFDAAARSADVSFAPPLDTLEAGEYLLTFDATRQGAAAKRHVRFRVR